MLKVVVNKDLFNDDQAQTGKQNLIIYCGSATKDYDGTELSCSKYAVTGLLPDHRIAKILFSGSISVAGECANALKDISI